MKITILSMLLCIICSTKLSAATITAVQDGNWLTTTTWDLGRVPQDNDQVIIPAARTVFFSGSPYPKNTPTVRPTLNIKIYGILDFSVAGNDKLYLDVGSAIQIFTNGKIQTSTSSSEIIAIYDGSNDNTVWTGTPSTISGPANATATSIGFANGVLPITLKSFTIKKSNKGFATLTWITSAEVNLSQFEIERSTSSSLNWQFAGVVNASGNSSSAHVYNFAVPLLAGENQFRLKQIDIDGRFTFSPVVSISYNSESVAVIYDQSSHQLLIRGYQNDPAKIFIYDLSGRTVYKGSASSNIIFEPSSAGAYFVNVVNQHSRLAKKITVY